jgi:D-amino-acid dehydrogenase
MEEMKKHLLSKGVEIIRNEEVTDLQMTGGKITSIQTSKQSLKADEFVLAAGAWSGKISKKLGFEILMQAGKGYAINRKKPTGITIPAILAEAKVAITPMNGFTRFAGTMEITEINKQLNRTRVEAIAQAAKRYYPEIELTQEEKESASFGLRPLSFDGLPYIGKSEHCKNLTVASGHAMMGWSMGTATGKLVSEIVSEKKTSLNISPFAVDRKN